MRSAVPTLNRPVRRPMTVGMERAVPGLARAGLCRWAEVGRSAHPDPTTAAHEAVHAALRAHREPGLLLAFVSGAYDPAVLGAALAEVAGPVPLVGCTTAAEFDAAGPASGSVLVLALGGEGFTFSIAGVSGAAPRDAGARAAACLGDVADREHRVLMLLTDGGAAIHPDIVRGAYSVTGAGVPLVGGVAGHPVGRPDSHAVLYGPAALNDAVVGVAIGSDAPLGIGVRHGWEPVGEPLLVTRAAPGRVLELDERPAREVYTALLDGEVSDANVLAHPLGIQPRVGEARVRIVRLDEATDGSVRCAIPAGALVWLMRATHDGVIDAADAACAEAVAALGGAPARALVAFDCAARLTFLGGGGDVAARETERVARHAAGAPVAGAYTHGEIARTRGALGFHHQTFVVLAIA
ncbi:hypothetical protein FSW04_01175 [Baekduia soli]|uniref:Histidine kinase n=1 Tax=Baekduia soli TaxID=496014 RepID=A0A5B8U028_9ACTN|nr:FIST N-terminal domain-containing protein [Baekduia soli]QEC46324.1 hypothetical protein FSW04_01175 [Baekduia soli]